MTDGVHESDRRDALIGRIVDGEASGEHWRRFRALAEQDPSIWNELAAQQRQHEQLAEAVDGALFGADGVETPERYVDERPVMRRIELVGRWGGWAAAAIVVLAWATGSELAEQRSQRPGGQQAGLIPQFGSPDEALEAYIDRGQEVGRVISEVPEPVVLRTHPRSDGAIEVVYLRQIMERKIVRDVYRWGADEVGNPVVIPTRVVRPVESSF